MSEPISRRVLAGSRLLARTSSMVATAVAQDRRQDAAAADDVMRDTFNGLLAFVVPGNDGYSVQQGVTVVSLGGVDAGAAESLIATLDSAAPNVPQFSAVVATLLNGLARVVYPSAAGPFAAPFACLTFAQKTAVFEIMDGHEAYQVLAGVLPGFVASFVHAEAGAFDPAVRLLKGTPLGWQLS